MPTFTAVVRDRTGAQLEQRVEAANQRAAERQLLASGFDRVVSMTEDRAAAVAKQKSWAARKKVGLKHLSIFCRQFATMINAGVSLVRCLDVLEQQTVSANLKLIIRDIQGEVEAGNTLSRALSKFPRVFSNLAVGLVRAGEVGGVLDETLERLAGFLEKDMELRRKVKAAMTYPVLVMIVAIGIVIFLVTFILPKFMKLFTELGVKEFPLPTRIMQAASNFMVHKWWVCLIIAVLLWVGVGRIRATRTGRRYYDIIKLKVPVFGSLNHKIAVSRFARTLATLLSSGVPILQAMETVAGTVDNSIISDAIMLSRTSIREGDTIGQPLAESRMFPPMVVQMITIGEETGQLDAMLSKVADFYEGEVESMLESLTAALEPVMIVFLGVVVGFIVISMFLPLIAIISSLSEN